MKKVIQLKFENHTLIELVLNLMLVKLKKVRKLRFSNLREKQDMLD
jgi:hypothetical protein